MGITTMGVRWTSHKTRYLCFTILILVLAHGSLSLNLEGVALLNFQDRVFYDPNGAFKTWNSDDIEPCLWSNVQCVFGHVEALDLKGLSLDGVVLAPEIGNLILFILSRFVYYNNLEGASTSTFNNLNLFYELCLDDNLTFVAINAIGFLNRKLGRCIWQSDFNPLWNADSLISPLTENIIYYLNPFQLFQKGISDKSYVNVEIAKNVHIEGSVISRKMVEKPANLESKSSCSDLSANGHTKAPPSTKNIGSVPAIRYESMKLDDVNPPSSPETPRQSSEYSDMWIIIIGVSCGGFLLFTVVALLFVIRNPFVKVPWRPKINRQLQKAFVTGVQKLDRVELEQACEDFSNIIDTMEGCMLFKGTLSSGVEICVATTTITRLKDWSKRAELEFHNKIETLSRVNHKNFINLIGFCEEDEPFVRMMVFEYAPEGLLSEHLHVQGLEHLDWRARMRIIMGVAYCLQYLHELNLPPVLMHLDSNKVYLTDDYAAKVADLSFWKEFYPKEKTLGLNESIDRSAPQMVVNQERNVYSFGVLLLEIISGKHTNSDKVESFVTWAGQFLKDKLNISPMIDPTLKSFKQNELEVVCEVIQECIQRDSSQRPTMKEIIPNLRQVLGISPEQATPKLSPLWWAELSYLETHRKKSNHM
uniref:protein MALE DISCOVERER 1-like n=1 Tax=Erigeron canadensis TaxID=72917 RepID=UPI001CB8B5F2|nr:protein MALE DISCOVERER 1-like [Erigeron canadensis]